MKGRILLVEPSPSLAGNLKVLLSTVKNFRIVGHSTSGLDAMRMMSALSPDVLIMDLSLADMTAMDVARWAQRLFPKTSLVLLSTYDLPEYRAAATRLKNTVLISKAELWRKMPQALNRLRREQLARERERGGILVTRLNRELRKAGTWLENTARTRNQAPIWRLIHVGMVLLSVELLLALATGGGRIPGLVVTGWAMLIVGLAHDFYTLARCAKPSAMSGIRVGHNV